LPTYTHVHINVHAYVCIILHARSDVRFMTTHLCICHKVCISLGLFYRKFSTFLPTILIVKTKFLHIAHYTLLIACGLPCTVLCFNACLLVLFHYLTIVADQTLPIIHCSFVCCMATVWYSSCFAYLLLLTARHTVCCSLLL